MIEYLILAIMFLFAIKLGSETLYYWFLIKKEVIELKKRKELEKELK